MPKCRPRMISYTAITLKLQKLADAGCDIDALPGDMTIQQMLALPEDKRYWSSI